MKHVGVLFLLGALMGGGAPAFADAYLGANSAEAERALQKTAGQDPSHLASDGARAEWARARLAWIALARLQGRQEQAVSIFSGCGKFCGDFGPVEEWKATKSWGCGQKPDAAPCKTK